MVQIDEYVCIQISMRYDQPAMVKVNRVDQLDVVEPARGDVLSSRHKNALFGRLDHARPGPIASTWETNKTYHYDRSAGGLVRTNVAMF